LTPAHTAEEWAAGSSKLPVTMSLDPANAGKAPGGAKKKAFKTVGILSKELSESQKRVAYLETLLKSNSITFD
jgi:hypothetical protein